MRLRIAPSSEWRRVKKITKALASECQCCSIMCANVASESEHFVEIIISAVLPGMLSKSTNTSALGGEALSKPTKTPARCNIVYAVLPRTAGARRCKNYVGRAVGRGMCVAVLERASLVVGWQHFCSLGLCWHNALGN